MSTSWKATALRWAGGVARRVPLDRARLFSFMASPAVRAEPWELYQRLHAKGPVRPGPMGSWLVASHEGVSAMLRHPNTTVDESQSDLVGEYDRTAPFSALITKSLLFTDPPEHHRLRRLVSRSFTPGRVEALHGLVDDMVHERLEKLRPRGEADLIEDFALPLPVAVISELLGIPHEDRDIFLGWARDLAPRFDIDLFRNEEIERRGDEAAMHLSRYLGEVLDDPRRRHPDGLIAAVAASEEDDDALDRDEIVALCGLLLVAGFETMTNLIANSVVELLRAPEQLERLRSGDVDPRSAAEELLRVAGPVQFTQRVPLEDIELDGHVIPARSLVALLLGAANRDPQVFDRPDELDLGRDPNPHLSFSFGIHHCLGAPLARLEAASAIPAIFEHLPNLGMTGPPHWRETFVLRGQSSLPVRWTR